MSTKVSTQVESNEISESQMNSNPPICDDVTKEYTSEGDEIVDTSSLRSDVWLHFQKLKLKLTGEPKARCLYCKKKLSALPKSGTTHLKDHRDSCP